MNNRHDKSDVMLVSIVFPAPGYPGHCGEHVGDVAGKSSGWGVPAGGEFGGKVGGDLGR